MSEPEYDAIEAVLVGGSWLPVTPGSLTVERIRQAFVGDGLLATFVSVKGARIVVDPTKIDGVQTSADPIRISPVQQTPDLDELASQHPGLTDPGGNMPFRPAQGGVTVLTVDQ